MASALLFVEFNGIICYYNRKNGQNFQWLKGDIRLYMPIFWEYLGLEEYDEQKIRRLCT